MNYEKILEDFWDDFDHCSGVQFFTAVEFGLEPKMYKILKTPLIGHARLNFKIWNGEILSLYFQNDDGFFKINTFFDEYCCRRHRAKDRFFDFKTTGILGCIFVLQVLINDSGNPVFMSASLI